MEDDFYYKKKDDISEEEMNDIISYINSWSYEKYEKDMEVREALQLLKNKMIKDEQEKEKLKNKNEIIEDNQNQENIQINEQDNMNSNISDNNKYNYSYNYNYENKDDNNENMKNNEIKELTEEEKLSLEKNWNNSIKIETGGQIINEKGDKEKIIVQNNQKRKETIKKTPKLFENQNKLLNIHSIGMPKISIVTEGDKIYKEKSADIPFLYSTPEF